MRLLHAILLCVAASTVGAAPATAPATQPAAAGPQVTKLTLHPSPTTQPALRYKLLPDLVDQAPGNAVPLYLLARRHWPDQKTNNELLYPENERFDYLGTPIDEFPPQYAERIFEGFGETLRYVDLGARRREAEWDAGWRERGLEDQKVFSYLADLHHAVNILGFRAASRVKQGDWAAAEQSLQTSFAVARHVGAEPLVIHALVQTAFIQSSLYRGVEEWVSRAGSPNLYWALSDLPQPFIELRPVAQMRKVEAEFRNPQIAKALAGNLPPEQWPAVLREMVGMVQEDRPPYRRTPAQVEAELKRLTAAAHPRAKAHLLAAGMPKEKVEAMSAAQAVGTYFCQEYAAALDGQWKSFTLPYPQAREQMDRAWRALAPDKLPALENPLVQAELVPRADTGRREDEGAVFRPNYAFSRVGEVRFRLEVPNRYIALLRTIEALRDYSARHDGRPPQSLGEVTDLPVPPDPITGMPFVYRLEGRTATLDAPAPEGRHPRSGWRYELTFAR